jgi:hypothetical protein
VAREALVAAGRQIANQARSRGGFESNRLNERLSDILAGGFPAFDVGSPRCLDGGSDDPVALAAAFENDNSPCVLPDGSIVSFWLGRPGGTGQHELKILCPSDGSTFVATVGDIADVGLACGA